jgi:hypothetical protein
MCMNLTLLCCTNEYAPSENCTHVLLAKED